MPTYLHPGVYVEEIPSGVKPIEGVSTSVTAFVGQATKGPVEEAVLVSSYDEYTAVFGDIASESDAMGLAVQAFYLNGGKAAYVARLVSNNPAATPASKTVLGQDFVDKEVLRIQANSVGNWGNAVYCRIIKPDQDALTFDLEIGHIEKDKFKVDETFAGLSMNEQEDNYALTQVNGNSAYVEFVLEPAGDPAHASEQYQAATLTGGKLDEAPGFFKTNMSGIMSLTLNINGLGAKKITIEADKIIFGEINQTDGDLVATKIVEKVKALSPDTAYQKFTCVYASNRFTLTSEEPSQNRSTASVVVYDGSDLAGLLRLDSAAKATLVGDNLDTANATLFSAGISGTMDLTLNIDDHGDQVIILKEDELGLQGLDHNTDGQEVAKAIKNAVLAINSGVAAYKDFTCVYANGHFTLTSGSSQPRTSSISVADNSSDLADLLGLDPTNDTTILTPGRQVDQGTARVIPQEELGTAPFNNGVQLTGGGETSPTSADYGTFFNQVLRKVRDVSILVLPGQFLAEDGSGNAAISEALAHAESTKSRMVIVDPPPGLELEQASQAENMAPPTSTYAVLYYPYVKVANPFYNVDTNPNASKTLTIAPSAFGAGMWAKIDGKRGVWKAPAGMETSLLGVAGLKFLVEDGEQDQLNPMGVNCLRSMPGSGPVIWGTRTLSTKADPEWRYVPVRRTAIMIEQSIYNGIQWAVFEPNKYTLWASLRVNIGSFMDGLFRAGAFQGQKASDAYFVRCGLGDTMTQGDIDRGQVIVIVGFAPVKPAEFVIVRIQQKVAQQ